MSSDEPRRPVIYDLTNETTYANVREKLATVPKDKWPDPDFYDDMLLSAHLRSMELGEQEARQL